MSITQIIKSNLLSDLQGVVHGFGLRGYDVSKYLNELKVNDRFIVETNQIHGDTIHCLFRPRKGGILQGDAFITDRPGMVCFVRTADCVPILIADKKNGAIAAVHAGWRGTAKDVVGKTVSAMKITFASDPINLVAAIGPRICSKCYEVGDEVLKSFEKLKIADDWRVTPNKIDLGLANKFLLKRAGITDENIDILPHCTFCDDRFASYRRDKNETERQFNFIILSPRP